MMKRGYMWPVMIVTFLFLGAPFIYSVLRSDERTSDIDFSKEILMNATRMDVYDVMKEKNVEYREGENGKIYIVQLMWVEHVGYRVYCEEENYELFDTFGTLSEKYRDENISFISIMVPSCCLPAVDNLFGDDYDMDDIIWPLTMDYEYSVYGYYMDVFVKDPTILIINSDFDVISITGILNESIIDEMIGNLTEYGHIDPEYRPEQVEKDIPVKTLIAIYFTMILLGLLSSACPCCFFLLLASALSLQQVCGTQQDAPGFKGKITWGLGIALLFALGNAVVFSLFGWVVPAISILIHQYVLGIIVAVLLMLFGLYFFYSSLKEFRSSLHSTGKDTGPEGFTCSSGLCGLTHKHLDKKTDNCHDPNAVHHHNYHHQLDLHRHHHDDLHHEHDTKYADHQHSLLGFQKNSEKLKRYPFWLVALIFGIIFGVLCTPCSLTLIIPSLMVLSSMSVELVPSLLFMGLVGFSSGFVILPIILLLDFIQDMISRYRLVLIIASVFLIVVSLAIIAYGALQLYWLVF